MSLVPIPKLPRTAAAFASAPVDDVFSSEMKRFSFGPWALGNLIDSNRRYRVEFDPRFPFFVNLFSYDTPPPFALSWHEHLEIFVPCAGRGRFVMEDRTVPFCAGDVLVVDNLKLHGIPQFQGESRRGMVIGFLPEFVCGLGSTPCDSEFLAPFRGDAILRANDPLAPKLHDALLHLVSCYFESAQGVPSQAGCKAYLLEILYLLAARFGKSQTAQQKHVLEHERSRLLDKLRPFLSDNLSERVTVARAASAVNMSQSTFMKYFKRVTGRTFITYLTRLRLERAAELLEHTRLSIAEISYSVGFADQSYFDRVFRRHFSRTPREVRRENSPIVIPHCARRHNLHIS
jgi:AraC-like DNA-binding protein/mannose-6-phosphate isomerase-like protein (cupin superfamily)